jgi:hypothetical protein
MNEPEIHEWDDPAALAEVVAASRRAALAQGPVWAPDGVTLEDLIDDPLGELHSKLMRPLFALTMSGAMLRKKLLSGDKSPAAASAETRYRNARDEIHALLTEYKEKQ